MLLLLNTLWQISCLKKSPSEIKFSYANLFILIAIIAVFSWSGIITSSNVNNPNITPPLAAVAVTCIILFQMAWVYGLLAYKNLHNRFVQTMIAVFGTEIVISIIGSGIIILFSILGLAMVGFIIVFLWRYLVLGFIFTESAAQPIWAARLNAILFLIAQAMLSALILGVK